jgi:hypothetical protein
MGQLKRKIIKKTKVLFKEIACLSLTNNPYNDKSPINRNSVNINSYLIPEFKTYKNCKQSQNQ